MSYCGFCQHPLVFKFVSFGLSCASKILVGRRVVEVFRERNHRHILIALWAIYKPEALVSAWLSIVVVGLPILLNVGGAP